MKSISASGAACLAFSLLQVSCQTPPDPNTSTEAPAPVPVLTTPALEETEKIELPAPQPRETLPEPPVAPPPVEKGTITQMDLGTLFELQGEGRAFIVDVRPAFWYKIDHIPGAISLPLKHYDSVFATKKAEFDAARTAGKVIVLYCTDEDCPDGRSTARRLAKAGYSSSVYRGGWKEWKASGLGG